MELEESQLRYEFNVIFFITKRGTNFVTTEPIELYFSLDIPTFLEVWSPPFKKLENY